MRNGEVEVIDRSPLFVEVLSHHTGQRGSSAIGAHPIARIDVGPPHSYLGCGQMDQRSYIARSSAPPSLVLNFAPEARFY